MRESRILQDVRDKCSHGDVRLYRNNIGVGLMINHKNTGTKQAIINACIQMTEKMGGFAQRVRFGLAEGSGDLIGYRKVGAIAQFVSLELKAETGRVRPEQTNWLNHVNQFGGLAGIVRSVEQARDILSSPIDKGLSAGAGLSSTVDGDTHA